MILTERREREGDRERWREWGEEGMRGEKGIMPNGGSFTVRGEGRGRGRDREDGRQCRGGEW